MKVRITSPQLSTFTGFMGPTEFVNGVTVNHVSELEYNRIKATVAADLIAVSPDFIENLPATASVERHQTLVLSVVTNSSSDVYEWKKDDVVIENEQSPTLKVSEADDNTAGVYKVSATNTAGSKESVACTISITEPAVQGYSAEPMAMMASEPEPEIQQTSVEEPTGEALYTQEQLEQIADQQGIAGLRELADQHDIKGRSIQELIDELLQVRQ